MTNVFTIGKTYAITGYNDTIKVVKRTDKSVWFEYAGETLRKKIHNVSSGEKIVLDGGSACVFPESVIEPQANNVVSLSDYRFSAKAIGTSAKAEPIEDVESAEIISLDELDLIHLIQDLTLIELENANRKKLETLESDTTEILETLEFPQYSLQDDSMNRGLSNRLAGWEYINSQASYENRSFRYYAIFSKLSTAAYNGYFEGVYFEKIYNWIDQMTATELDVFVTEFKDLDSAKHYVVFADHAMKLYQSREIEPDTIIPSVNVETIEVIIPSVNPSFNLNTLEISTSENLETLEFPQDEILETLENPQGSTQDLDKFEVTYQVAESEYEVSYESRTVYALSHEHAKSIVIQSLQAQNLRHIITGCEYALMIDDLSDFAMAGYDEF